jgi:tRNA(adenine34) deaminase
MAAVDHEPFMREALELAAVADREGDMGVGSVVVKDGRIVGRGRNRIRTRRDPNIHAETEALADALKNLGTDSLAGCTVYATMEPCPMCAGALLNAGVLHWVLGGRFKAVGRTDLGQYSVENFARFMEANVTVTTGVLQDECQALRNRYWQRNPRP